MELALVSGRYFVSKFGKGVQECPRWDVYLGIWWRIEPDFCHIIPFGKTEMDAVEIGSRYIKAIHNLRCCTYRDPIMHYKCS